LILRGDHLRHLETQRKRAEKRAAIEAQARKAAEKTVAGPREVA
jgi:hypothetical protein